MQVYLPFFPIGLYKRCDYAILKTMQRQDYPRPEFVRPRIMVLDGEWECTNKSFSAQEAARESFEYRFRTPCLPGGMPHRLTSPALWLRRRFFLQPFDTIGTAILNFNGISGSYSVYLNEKFLFSSTGPQSNHIDVSAFVLPGENVLTVYSASEPYSKGITGAVWLEFAAKSFFSFLRPTAVYANQSIYLRGMIAGETEGLKTVAEVALDGKLLLSETYRAAPDFTLHVPLKRLPDMWSEGRGKIFDVRVSLTDGKGAVLDRVYTYTAFKETNVVDGDVYVNGRKAFFKALSDPLYYPATLSKPRSQIFAEGVAKAQASGFNTIYFDEYPSPTELYVLDKFGMYAAIRLPDFTEYEQSYYSLIMRDFGHPCIMIWEPELNNYTADTAKNAYAGIKAKDPTHFVSFGAAEPLYAGDFYTFTAPTAEIPLYSCMRFNGGIMSEKEEIKFKKSHPGLMSAEELQRLPAFLYCEKANIPDFGDKEAEKRFKEDFKALENATGGLSGYLFAQLYDSPKDGGILNYTRNFKAVLFETKTQK